MEAISFAVSIAVIIGMTGAFSILFNAYARYKKYHIDNGHEDMEIRKELTDRFEKKKSDESDIFSFAQERIKREKKGQKIADVFFSFILGILMIVGLSCFLYRVEGNQIFINDVTYMTIQTGSMSEKNKSRLDYADLPDNQISQFSLIGIEKVKEKDLKLHDIIAFENGDAVYVHRIVGIREENGRNLYTTKGDANTGSFSFETSLKYSEIIGRFNGFQSFGLGVTATYLSSNIGLIAWTFSTLFLIFVDFSETRIGKRYDVRYLAVATKKENPEEDLTEHVCRYNRSFTAKLIQSNDVVKQWYSDIKNHLLSYENVKSFTGWKSENYRLKKESIVRLTIRGKTLCLFFTKDMNPFMERYRIENLSKENKPFFVFRIRSARKAQSVIKLIDEMMADYGATKNEREAEDYYLPYENNAVLLKKGLIKRKIVSTESFYTRLKNDSRGLNNA